MKRKVDSSESQKDGTIDIEQNSSNSFKNHRLEFTDRKTKKKMPHISNRLSAQNHGKISAFSSASKINSYLKGNSISEPDQFKSSESTFFNQLAQKYVPRGTSRQKMREQMQLALQRKRSEIEALRVHRDQLKFISYNNPYDIPIKISLAVLKEKAKMQEKIKDYKMLLRKDIKDLDSQFNMMTDYFNYVTNALKAKGEEDLIIDTQEEQKLMIENLQKENNHLFRQLKEEDKKNAKEIKNMQEEIAILRVSIKDKEDKIRDLKSKICFLHIKLHSRSSNSKEKSMSMSIRKFNSEHHVSVQQAFIGNSSFKSFSKEIIQKVQSSHEMVKIKFYYDKKRQLLTFRCVYKSKQGRIHHYREDIYAENAQFQSPPKDKLEGAIQIRTKYILSCKFYFKSRIVGVECRVKSEKGTENVLIGNCSSNLEHQLLTLVNKRIVTLSSYWHQKDMIGIGVWYCLRREHTQRAQAVNQQTKKEKLKLVRSAHKLNTDYYN